MQHRIMVRTALLLAITLLLQSLRFYIPVPVFFSTLIIGSLVNACLMITLETTGFYSAVIIAVATPLVAYFQQLLPLPVFILPVALGNIAYVGIYKILSSKGRWTGLAVASAGKTAVLFALFTWLLSFLQIHPKIAAALLAVMSWPQFITAVAGGILAAAVIKRLKI